MVQIVDNGRKDDCKVRQWIRSQPIGEIMILLD